MENGNHPPYGHHNVGGSYYPQQQPLYPPQGTYPMPTSPPPGYPSQQPPPSGQNPQGYLTNSIQHPPPAGGYGQPGIPPAQPSYTSPYQQPGSQYQWQPSQSQNQHGGQPSYCGYLPQSTGSFEPSAPQYAQQLSPPQTLGYPPPSPSASNGYNPQNPPPLPPRSPAAQMSFAPPPVTAVSSKTTGTLGRLGARVAGTVQSKVKDYLAAKQDNIQSASLGPKPSGTTAAFMPSYGHAQPSQPWQAPNVGASSYPASGVPPVSHVPPPSGEYQTGPSPHSYHFDQATSSTPSPDRRPSQEPPSNVSMCAAASPPMIIAPAPPASSISGSSAPRPLTATPSPSPQDFNTSHSEPKPSTVPTSAPTELSVAQPTLTTGLPRPDQPDQVIGQGSQTAHTPSNPSMTWGWNMTFNPASQPLGQFVPQLNLTPMFTAPDGHQAVSDPVAQTTAPATSTEVLDSPGPSRQPPPSDAGTSQQRVLAELSADQAPHIPEKVPLQAVSQSLGPSSDQTGQSGPKSAGFQPYRPTKGSDGKPIPAKPASHMAPRPLNASEKTVNPNGKPKPKPKEFQPYRAPKTLSEENRDLDHSQNPGGQSAPGATSEPYATSSPSTAQSRTQPSFPLVSHSPSSQDPRAPTNASPTSVMALGDLITDHIQNLAISSAQTGSPRGSVPPRKPSCSNSSAATHNTGPGTHRSSSNAGGESLQSIYHDEYCPYPMLTTPMLAHGRSTASQDSSTPQPARFCYGAEPAHYPRSYYRHPQALSFPICTWCFNTYIAHTSQASAFPESLVVRAASVVCGFNVPRITKLLWPAAVKSGHLTDLVQFMEKRYPTLPTASADPENAKTAASSDAELTLIKPCKRRGQHVYSHEGYKWYTASTPSPSAQDLMVCEACYEDLVLATPAFAPKFTGPLPQPETEILACMVSAHPYLERALSRYGGTTADWEGFIQAANMRLELTQNEPTTSCNGLQRRVASCRWWTLKGYENTIASLPSGAVEFSLFCRTQASKHVVLCESCYLDAVVGTRFERIFEMVAEPPLEDMPAWDDERYNLPRWCTYSSGLNHAIADAFMAANMRKLSPQSLYTMLEEIASKPRCGQVPSGMQDGLFYKFTGAEGLDFGICEGHYGSTIKGFGLDQLFGDSPVQIPGQAFCAFHPAVVRADQWINKMNEAIDTGDFTIYRENVCKFAGIPICPRRDAVENRHWYGWPDCAICPDCFEQFASGTKLAEDMPWKNEFAECLVICSMYSPRQREMYNRACESGDVDRLLAACQERTKIWNRTVPRMTVLAAQKSIANGQAMLAAQLAHSHATSNAISFGDDGTRWTTSSGNTYQSCNGVLAEKYRNEAEALDAKVRGLDPTSESIHLAVLWESVE
ncbi:hypothetical protein V8F06_013071 [Rhypophila decipiens]